MKIRKIIKKVIPLSIMNFFYSIQEENNADNNSLINNIVMGNGSKINSLRKLNGPQYIKIGNDTIIGNYSWLGAYDEYAGNKYTPSLEIGDNVNIGDFACITCIGRLIIGSGCLISEYVYISDHVHGFNPEEGLPIQQHLISKGDIEIGERSFIGYRVSILPGAGLGRCCVVGSHSVVTHSFPDFSMVMGIPARLVKRYSNESHSWIKVYNE